MNNHQILSFIKHFFVAKRNGHGVHSPFAYKLCEDVFYNTYPYSAFEDLKKIRQELLSNNQKIEIEDFGAGSKTFKSNVRKIKDIAKKGISPSLQSQILYRLFNFLKCRNGIELGSSIGLNALYLSKVNKNAAIISIEGSQSLYAFAKQLAANNNGTNIEFIHAKFDDAFPKILEKLATIDFLYIDGNHTYAATLNYFNLALSKTNKESVMVFDDIYWSEEMTKAWNEIKNHPSVTLSIDTFYFGLIFFKEEFKEKINLKLYL